MKQQIKSTVIAGAVAALLIAAPSSLKAQSTNFQLGKSLDIEYEILKAVASSYVDTVDYKKMVTAGVKAMLNTLDPYTVYISEEESDAFEMMTTGNYGGVGAIIRKKVGEGVLIVEPYEGSPAAKNHLQPGDSIIMIDGKPVYEETSEQSSGRMKGQPATNVNFKVVKGRSKDTVDVVVTREIIHVSDIPYYGMYDDTTGIIVQTGFTANISDEFKSALVYLKQQGAQRLVIDLRDNGGGVMDEAIDIVSLFVPKGTLVVSSKGRLEDMNREYRTTKSPVDTLMPVLVMVNGNSASASEITAGALQDLKRATIAGERSFGKGLIQSVRPMPYNSQVKITTGKYYTPSGRCVQAIDYSHRKEDGSLEKDANGGIAPDIEVASVKYSRPVVSLVYNDVVGSYAIEYFLKHPDAPVIKDFKLSDEEYEDFIKFAAAKEFDSRTSAKTAFDQMVKAAKEEDDYEMNKAEIEALASKLDLDKESILRAKKSEIIPFLEEEIATCYGFNRAGVQVSVKYDRQLAEAISHWNR